jgi:hypothetical protein
MIECPSCSGQGGAGKYCEDCQCTGSVSVPTNVAEHLAWLEKHATAETQRAEAAEAKLAAVPVEAIRFFWLPYQDYRDKLSSGEVTLAQRHEWRMAVRAWLEQQEAQP